MCERRDWLDTWESHLKFSLALFLVLILIPLKLELSFISTDNASYPSQNSSIEGEEKDETWLFSCRRLSNFYGDITQVHTHEWKQVNFPHLSCPWNNNNIVAIVTQNKKTRVKGRITICMFVPFLEWSTWGQLFGAIRRKTHHNEDETVGEISKLQRSDVNQGFSWKFLAHPQRLLHSFSITRRKKVESLQKRGRFWSYFQEFYELQQQKDRDRVSHTQETSDDKKGMNSEGWDIWFFSL